MKQNVEIVAYIFADAAGTLSALRFLDGIRVTRRGASIFDLQSTTATLPRNFFSENVSHVAAIVGSNASGKSTALQDINRILAGQRPVAARYALVIRCDRGIYQLCSEPTLVQFDGRKIDVEDARDNANLKVVFYAGGYDPLGRTKALVPASTGIQSCDISDQFVYNEDPARDFDYKLIYLQTLIETEDPSLFLEAEGRRRRSIRFEARAGYDANVAARDFLESVYILTDDFEKIEDLLAVLGLDSTIDKAEIQVIQSRLLVSDAGNHFLPAGGEYFESLYNYLATRPRRKFPYSRLEFALALGAIVERLRTKSINLAKHLRISRLNFKTLVTQALGKEFYTALTMLPIAASDTLSEDGTSIEITLGGHPDTTSSIQKIFALLLRLRQLDGNFSFRFTGISEGQRTLLTFYSRLLMQAVKFRHDGNTLLLIDEHEHGLHPEWQRRYLHELLTFLKKRGFASERYQIVLSTHSPFLVSDLPATHVNRIGIDTSDDSPTLAANVLELLLSPLFLENSTSEFARRKIEEILNAVSKARSIEAVNTASALLPLLGDELIRTYCAIRVEEKKSSLMEKRARQQNRVKGRV